MKEKINNDIEIEDSGEMKSKGGRRVKRKNDNDINGR